MRARGFADGERVFACEFDSAPGFGDNDWRSFSHCRRAIAGLVIAGAMREVCGGRMWQVVVEVGGRWKIAEVGVGSALTGSRKLGLQKHDTFNSVYKSYSLYSLYSLHNI